MPICSLKRLLLSVLSVTFVAWSAPAMADAPVQGAYTRGSAIFGSCPQKPVWPAEALRDKRAGTVTLAFLIGADATVLESKVAQSSGHADLDEAARVGLAVCKFRPPAVDGKPVQGWVAVRYNWVP